jgi:hypothetical protein
MYGVPYHEQGLVVGGGNVDGIVQARSVADLGRFYHVPGVWPDYISNDSISEADRVAAGIRFIFAQRDTFLRLQRGFDAWTRAVQEKRAEYRLHQFVRATEALVKPERSVTQRQFVHRCLTSFSAHPRMYVRFYGSCTIFAALLSM